MHWNENRELHDAIGKLRTVCEPGKLPTLRETARARAAVLSLAEGRTDGPTAAGIDAELAQLIARCPDLPVD